MINVRFALRLASVLSLASLLLTPSNAMAQAAAPQGDSINAIPQQAGFIQKRPDIAYDANANVYLAVSAGPNLRGRFLNADGTPLGVPFDVDQGGATQQVPRVAWSPDAGSAGAFLVTWLDYRFNDRSSIWGRLVSTGANGVPGFVTPEFLISDPFDDVHSEMGAALAYSTGSDVFLVIYRDNPRFEIRGQRISNTGAKVGAEIAVTNNPYWEGEPTMAYNPDRDEFMLAYFAEPVDRAGLAVTVPVRASDGVVTRGPVAYGGGAFISVPQIEYDTARQKYLAAYFTYKPGPVFEARWLLADGTPDPALGTFPLVAGYGSYDGFQLVRNPRTETYLAAFHGITEDDVAIEVSSGGTPTPPFRATFSCPSCTGINVARGSGNFNPRIAASSNAPRWTLVTSRSFTETVAQHFVGTAANSAGGGTTPPPPPPPPPPPTPIASRPQMSLDLPATNTTPLQPFLLAGWAIDQAATQNTGVNRIDVWAFPLAGGEPRFLGNPTYGSPRPDVAAAFQGSQFTTSGFGALLRGMTPGTYTLRAFAFSTIAGQFNNARETTVTVRANPHMHIDLPSPNFFTAAGAAFRVSGWALDLASGTGTGVDTIHVWAIRDPDTAPAPSFLGVATLGHARPDVRTHFGADAAFANTGFNLDTSLSQRGTYDIVVFVHSSVTNTFVLARVVRMRVL